ncbi:MAG: hypothetical protein HQL56_01550 [Magnetococcales bacterium]|nr:hypothetical protein [Magnetococcales bacterium]
MSVTDTLNSLLQKLLPAINLALPTIIKTEGLDPLATVVSGSDTLGKINLGICKASAKASYSITNMTGLSGMVVNSLTLLTVASSDNLSNVTGTLSYAVSDGTTLSAKVSGKIKAGCGGISDSESISGTVSAKGVTGTGTATFAADLTGTGCLTKVVLDDLSLNYSDVDVHIDGLGVFNEFLAPLVDAIDDLFGKYIKNSLSGVVEKALDDLLDDEMPFCLS